jgi:hypothetical protein
MNIKYIELLLVFSISKKKKIGVFFAVFIKTLIWSFINFIKEPQPDSYQINMGSH